MKQKFLRLFLTILVALVSTASYAYDAEINGINYDLSGSATVVSGPVQYSGDITVPSTVVYNGETYSVTSIGDYAFLGAIL